jgi:hypothetical protein
MMFECGDPGHACRVEIENGVVKNATYNYAD